MDDYLPDAYLFRVEAISYYLEEIELFLTSGTIPAEDFATQKRHLVAKAANSIFISGELHKLGSDGILQHCVMDHE